MTSLYCDPGIASGPEWDLPLASLLYISEQRVCRALVDMIPNDAASPVTVPVDLPALTTDAAPHTPLQVVRNLMEFGVVLEVDPGEPSSSVTVEIETLRWIVADPTTAATGRATRK